MSISAASRYPATNIYDPITSQLSEEELNKLQEIHELINLMLRELPVGTQNRAQPYFMPALPLSPYTHSLLHWRVPPYMAPSGF
jgi:hypothetical protein